MTILRIAVLCVALIGMTSPAVDFSGDTSLDVRQLR